MRDNNYFYRRLFEMIPGFLTWLTLGSLFIFAFIKPLWVAIFVITFDIYWVIRVGYLTLLLLFAYRRLEKAKKIDWLKKCEGAGTQYGLQLSDLYQAVLFPIYKEDFSVLNQSLSAIEQANYSKEKIIIVLSVEERGGDAVWENASRLLEKYSASFFKFIITKHPDGLPNEMQFKGANATWGAKVLKDFVDSKKIDYEKIVISCFDADTCAEREYFSCLAYHYITNPRRTRSSYQPIPVYNNNIWQARSIARILELGASFMQMIETMRLEKFVTFSSHSMSFKTLVDIDYWPVDMISDDSAIYWKCFLHFNGDYSVMPMYVTVSMDVATEKGVLDTMVKQYKQKRRWAWGVENFPYVMMGFLHNDKIPISKKLRRAFHLLEGHYTWAVWAIIVTFIAPLPLIFGGGLFRQTAIGYNLPSVSATLFRVSLFTLGTCIFITMRLLPPRPSGVKPQKMIVMILQWFVSPLVAAVLGSTPAIDAQTHLMLGKYIVHFNVTKKSREK